MAGCPMPAPGVRGFSGPTTIKPKKVAFPKEVGITGEKPQKFS
jgi:hypothetical protein